MTRATNDTLQAVAQRPVRSELTWLLVGLDREFTRDQPWEALYAQRLVQHFASGN